jgi:adenine-specific DNA-methyltransferase
MDPELVKKVYTKVQKDGERKGEKYRSMGLYQSSLDARANQRYFIEAPDGSLVIPPGSELPKILKEGEKVLPKNNEDGCWRWIYETYIREKEKGNIEFSKTSNKVLIDANGNPSDWNVNTKIWLNDREEAGQLPNDLLTKYENRHSAKELKELGISFDFAKPSELIEYLIRLVGIKDDDIVLDFFSGSSTTAHALLAHKSRNIHAANSKFILVQLPEQIDETNEAFRDGFRNICEIGKERIRRAAKKLKEEIKGQIDSSLKLIENKRKEWADEKNKLLKDPNFFDTIESEIDDLENSAAILELKLQELDLGFRVFRLSESNMQDVYHKPQDYKQEALDLFADNIKPDRTPDDLLIQIMLAWGLPLSLKIEQTSIVGKSVYKVAENSLYACFDMDIDEEFAKEIAKSKPLRIVFRDKGFKDDTAKANVRQLLKQLSPETEVKVI